MEHTWHSSRDATSNPGAAGVDRERADSFKANLNFNLRKIADQLAKGEYGFQKLKALFIPKTNSPKLRVICIPTVRDRLVQRAIVNYLYSNRRIPVRHPFSFGFVKGSGSRDAINAAIDLRGRFEWCLKTDIEAFFDRIPRDYLKKRVEQTMRGSSLIPLLKDAIDCEIEIKKSPLVRTRLEKQGIKMGVGLRQGMPLSPILSNLLLSNFDRNIQRNGVEMIRYADDLVLFFRTKQEAHKGKELVARLLSELELSIGPTKTQVVGPDDPLHFLGREIVRISTGAYVAQISRLQISRIVQYLEESTRLAIVTS